MLLQLYFNTNEFVKGMLGTYDLAAVAIGFICAALGAFLAALGITTFAKDNITPDPNPNPTVITFVFKNRASRIAGSFIVIFIVMRLFAPDMPNTAMLITFSFGLGFFNYLVTEWLVNFLFKPLVKVLPDFSIFKKSENP